MNRFDTDEAIRLVSDLIAIPSVNPMGRDHPGPAPVERDVVVHLEHLFSPYSITMERQACSSRHENLLITIPGELDSPCVLFESHMDTVPAVEWADRAFSPHVDGTRVIGRGANDDKGPLAAMAMAAISLLKSKQRPRYTVLFLAAGDEEYAQHGIKHFIATSDRKISRGIFGEPTENRPIIQHKGVARWDIVVHGRSAHSSQPHLGRNAISDMIRVIEHLQQQQNEMSVRLTNPLMKSGPTLTVTMIEGGRTRNAVPDECKIAVDFRLMPGMEPETARLEVIDKLNQLGLEISHCNTQVTTPPLSTAPDNPLTRYVCQVCEQVIGEPVSPSAASYGTDAAWLRAPAIVLGPGNINSAHAIDEFIDANEIVQCAEIYRNIMIDGGEKRE